MIDSMSGICQRSRLLLLAVIAMFLSACSSVDAPPVKIESTQSQDGAPSLEKDVDQIPDAVPKPVTRTKAGNKSPYTVFGQSYTLLPDSKGYKEQGYASWYGTKFHGRYTANGEIYDMWGMTAAHKTLPIPSYVRVVNLHNDHSIIVRVNDRGPFHSDRIIDLSYAAAKKLGFADKGVAFVEVTDVTPDQGGLLGASAEQAQPLPSRASPVVTVLPPKPSPQPPVAAPAPTTSTTPIARAVPVDKKAITPVTWQVGAFRQQASASKLQQKLADMLTVPVKVVSSQGSPQWHRVRVGPIGDQKTLDDTRNILAKQGIKKLQPVK